MSDHCSLREASFLVARSFVVRGTDSLLLARVGFTILPGFSQ
jgi:hypothetical protein